MSLDLRPALDLPIQQLAELMTRGFEGYFVPIRETAEGFAERLRRDSIDLQLSRVARRDGEAVGIALIAARGDACRLAAMGIPTEARRTGVGRQLTDAVVGAARGAGYCRVVLEVITANTGAVALYRSAGFTETRKLVGWKLPAEKIDAPPEANAETELHQINPRELARLVSAEAPPDLPWQLAPETLAGWGPPARAFRLGEAFALVSAFTPESITLLCLWVPPTARRQGDGRRMLDALRAQHPGCICRVPAIVPEGLGDEFLRESGFARIDLEQYEMVLAL